MVGYAVSHSTAKRLIIRHVCKTSVGKPLKYEFLGVLMAFQATSRVYDFSQFLSNCTIIVAGGLTSVASLFKNR